MKRGKRQIIQKPIFQSQQQTPTSFQTSTQSSVLDSWTGITQQTQKYQTKPIFDEPHPVKNRIPENSIQDQKAQHEVSENKMISPAEDERKKRLEMLRQKYLKSGSATAAKEQQIRPIVSKKQQKMAQQTESAEKHEEEVDESKNSIFNAFKSNEARPNHNHREKHFTNTQIQENKLQNETPFSKPTQMDQHRKLPLAVPESKRKKAPPPPPKIIPSPQPQRKQNSIEEKSEAMVAEHDFNPFESQKQEKKEHTIVNIKKPDIKQPNNYLNENEREQQIPNFNQLIYKWVNNQRKNNKKSSESNSLIKQISSEIVRGCSQQVQQLLVAFLLSNTTQYSKSQSSVVMNIVRDTQLSELTRVFLSIKCGSSALELFCGQVVTKNTAGLLNNLIQLKSQFLSSQLNSFIKYYLENGPYSEQMLPLLVQLEPTCLSLYQYMNNIQFSNFDNAAKILLEMRDHITEQMCPFYFKLIHLVISQIQDSSTLENIVKLVNGINFQSAYHIKKETKLKIIQYIDRITNGVSQPNISRPPVKETQPVKTEKQTEKGGGINFMGYFNQAIKKITSQIPEKSSQPANSPEQPKETIEWDPVMKRYRINGKVPEDQYGKVEIPVSEEAENKPKKKAPPPPPPRVSSKITQPKQPVQTLPEPSVVEVQSQEQPQFSSPQMNNNEQEERMGIPVPPRAGLKGINSKKPRVQVRYS